MNKEEFDTLIDEILKIPYYEEKAPISAYGSVDVDELREVIQAFNKIPDYNVLIKDNNKMRKEIQRLKEEYIMLQNASDKVEEEKDKEIERLNNIINKSIVHFRTYRR